MWNTFDAITMSKSVGESTDPIKYVIISTQRSGSNLLCGMLGSHPQIISFHELFHPASVYYGLVHRGKFNFGTVLERDRQPYKFLAKIYNKDNGAKAVGFKIFPGHNQKILDFLLKNPDIKKIILKRENLLFSYTSKLTAQQTKNWQQHVNLDTKSADSGAKKKAEKVHVDIKGLMTYIKENHDFFDYVEKQLTGQKSICVTYREMITDDKIIPDLIEFIGVNNDMDFELKKLHTKQNIKKLSDRISNFEELKQKLSNTPYETFLNEEFDTN